MHLFVYYEAAPGAAESVRAAVALLQAELALPGARLMRRLGHAGPNDTWMEVYEDVPAGFESRLDALVGLHGLNALAGPRHVERFEIDPRCA